MLSLTRINWFLSLSLDSFVEGKSGRTEYILHVLYCMYSITKKEMFSISPRTRRSEENVCQIISNKPLNRTTFYQDAE